MFNPVEIAPSLLSANLLCLKHDIDLVKKAGADYLHVDVMDGHFVPNLSMGVPLVKSLVGAVSMPLDVHLMVSNPLDQLPWFLEAGAHFITVHTETLDNDGLMRALQIIHKGGAKAAFAIKPSTSLKVLDPFVAFLDMILVMSVEPGFSGQSYRDKSEQRVAQVVQIARRAHVNPRIQVDGGITAQTAGRVVAAGADVLVCGNAVFATSDPARALKELRSVANGARESSAGAQVPAVKEG